MSGKGKCKMDKYTEYLGKEVYDAGRQMKSKPNWLMGTLNRFKRKLEHNGGVETTRSLIRPGAESSPGFQKLQTIGRLDISLEAVLLVAPQFHKLFDKTLIEECYTRLKGAGESIDKFIELRRREGIYNSLQSPEVVSNKERVEKSIHRGGAGIWRDLATTKNLASDGVAVGVLANREIYDDEISEKAIHYYFSGDNCARDASENEILSLINCHRYRLPIFVIRKSQEPECSAVRFGYITNLDEKNNACLIEYLTKPPSIREEVEEGSVRLNASREEKEQTRIHRERCPKFRYAVKMRTGDRCAVCSIRHEGLLEAAHIKPVHKGGSDDSRIGVLLCRNHHKAFDDMLFSIEPKSYGIVYRGGSDSQELQITEDKLCCNEYPAQVALQWHWKEFQRTSIGKARS